MKTDIQAGIEFLERAREKVSREDFKLCIDSTISKLKNVKTEEDLENVKYWVAEISKDKRDQDFSLFTFTLFSVVNLLKVRR